MKPDDFMKQNFTGQCSLIKNQDSEVIDCLKNGEDKSIKDFLAEQTTTESSLKLENLSKHLKATCEQKFSRPEDLYDL